MSQGTPSETVTHLDTITIPPFCDLYLTPFSLFMYTHLSGTCAAQAVAIDDSCIAFKIGNQKYIGFLALVSLIRIHLF